jgi:DNA-binding NarL/FixJ family response regulator
MSGETVNRKSFLLVDDDAGFLTGLQELFAEMARGRWDIFTAGNHAQALALLSKFSVDVVVLDIGMPVVDGVQFLQLLSRTHPSQQVVMLTARRFSSKSRRRRTALPPCLPRSMRWPERCRKEASAA